MKRFLAIALAALMVFALVGCGKKKRQPIQLTLSTEDSEAILRAAGIRLPSIEEAKGANSTVKWFCWGDPFQNYTEDEMVNTGYWTFQQMYNGKIEYVETTYQERNSDLARLLTSEDAPDITSGGTNSTAIFPQNCLKDMYQPVDDYINYDDPLWAPMKKYADFFTLKGKHYQIILNTKPSNVCVYNTRVINEYGFDDPAELYYNDDWTWDKFYDMCFEFSDGDANRYALDGYAYQGALMESTGQQILQFNDDYTYYSNLDSPEIERAENLVYDLVKNDCCYHEGTNRWALRNNGTFGSGLKEGTCLFYVIGESFFTGPVDEISQIWGDIANGEVMFAPMPRDPQGDGVYYLASCFEDIKGSIAIVKGAKNPEGGALLATCMRFKIVDPIVINIDENQLRNVYKWNDDMIEMSKICKEIATEHERLDATGNLPDNLQNAVNNVQTGITRAAEPTTWAQLKETYREQIEYYIDELNNDIANYNAS